MGEDLARARAQVVQDYLEPPACRSTWTRSASTSSASVARPASVTPARCVEHRGRHRRRMSPSVPVLSGNRNFEGRVHPLTQAELSRLAAAGGRLRIAGTLQARSAERSAGQGSGRQPVYLKDIWPTNQEIRIVSASLRREMFRARYDNVSQGPRQWQAIQATVEPDL